MNYSAVVPGFLYFVPRLWSPCTHFVPREEWRWVWLEATWTTVVIRWPYIKLTSGDFLYAFCSALWFLTMHCCLLKRCLTLHLWCEVCILIHQRPSPPPRPSRSMGRSVRTLRRIACDEVFAHPPVVLHANTCSLSSFVKFRSLSSIFLCG